MEQEIRFCELDGRRIAYATAGAGPLLLFAARWVSHLEEEWDDPQARAFFEDLAQAHRVVRYDRLGAGLSDRDLPAPPTTESEMRALGTVLEACREETATIFSCSCAGLATVRFASAAPERVDKLVFFGGYVSRRDVPEVTRGSLVEFTRLNWTLAAQMFSGLLVPHASGDEIAAVGRHLRRAADAKAAAAFLELELTADARPYLSRVTMPSLVLHRRGDRTVPIGHGRELASLLPNARFVALGGDAHLPWLELVAIPRSPRRDPALKTLSTKALVLLSGPADAALPDNLLQPLTLPSRTEGDSQNRFFLLPGVREEGALAATSLLKPPDEAPAVILSDGTHPHWVGAGPRSNGRPTPPLELTFSPEAFNPSRLLRGSSATRLLFAGSAKRCSSSPTTWIAITPMRACMRPPPCSSGSTHPRRETSLSLVQPFSRMRPR